jgi:hypothetical protein
VLAPPATKPVDVSWVRAYRTAAIREVDIVERTDGIRLTSRGRTALDLSRFVAPDDLLSIIEQAMRDGNLSETAMTDVAVDFISPQRPWLDTYLRQFDRRSLGGPAESHPEVRVALALEAAGVVGLERQHRVHLPGFGPARFDLAVPRLRWAIEIDIHPRHMESIGRMSDARRGDAATSIGWTTTRVARDQYELDFSGTVASLAARYTQLRAA